MQEHTTADTVSVPAPPYYHGKDTGVQRNTAPAPKIFIKYTQKLAKVVLLMYYTNKIVLKIRISVAEGRSVC